MKITLKRGRVYSVEIQGGFTGPYINLELDPAAAYELLQALDAKREDLRDMANNYSTCRECGETHHNSVKVCPTIGQEDDDR